MGVFNDQMLILVILSLIINHETIMYFLDTSDKNYITNIYVINYFSFCIILVSRTFYSSILNVIYFSVCYKISSNPLDPCTMFTSEYIVINWN